MERVQDPPGTLLKKFEAAEALWFTEVTRFIKNLQEKLETTGVYIGDASTDGSYRIVVSGDNLLIQQRESSVWNTKSTISGA